MNEKFSTKALHAEDIVALLGKYNLKHLYERGVVTMEINKILIHEDWKTYVARYDADIAILYFEREIQLVDNIKTVCIPLSSKAFDLKEGDVVGWGTSERTEINQPENTPRKIKIKAAPSNEFCFLHESSLIDISSNRTFCAGGENEGPCLGGKHKQ